MTEQNLANDDASALAARILRQEHKIYPLAVRLFAEGRLEIEGRRVVITDAASDEQAALITPPC